MPPSPRFISPDWGISILIIFELPHLRIYINFMIHNLSTLWAFHKTFCKNARYFQTKNCKKCAKPENPRLLARIYYLFLEPLTSSKSSGVVASILEVGCHTIATTHSCLSRLQLKRNFYVH